MGLNRGLLNIACPDPINAPGKATTPCRSMDIPSSTSVYSNLGRFATTPPSGTTHPSSTSTKSSPTSEEKTTKGGNPLDQDSVTLSSQTQDKELIELKARDREVRAHEAAHAAAAGSVATGSPQFTFQRGSDGRLYAVGGEVSIDTSPVPGDPQATIQKAQTIRAAASAPSNPSAQDRSVAAQASRMEAQARRELQEERTQEIQDTTNSAETAKVYTGNATSSQSTPVPEILDLFA